MASGDGHGCTDTRRGSVMLDLGRRGVAGRYQDIALALAAPRRRRRPSVAFRRIVGTTPGRYARGS